jgi:TolA-binding protein
MGLHQMASAQTTPAAPEASASNPEAIRLFNSAVELQNQGLFGLAAAEWRDLLSRFGDDPLAARASYYLGTCLFQEQNYDEAAKAFSEVVAKYPQFAQRSAALVNQGLAAYSGAQNATDPQQARTRYEQAVRSFTTHVRDFADDPLAAQSRFYLGESQYSLGDIDAALATYTAWLAQHPQSELLPRVQLALGSTALEAGKPQQALGPLQALIEANVDRQTTAAASLRLGEALLTMGRASEAIDRLQAAAGVDFADADYALQQLGVAQFEAGDLASAMASYASVAERFPESNLAAPSLVLAAQCAVESGEPAKAIELAQQARDRGADPGQLAHWQARAEIDLGKAAAALTTIDAATDKVQDDATRQLLLLDRADALYAGGDTRQESLAAYEAAARGAANPEAAGRALHLAAATALELGKLDQAVRLATLYGERFAEGVDRFDTLQVLAEAQLQGASAEQAAATYRQLITAVDPADDRLPDWQVRLGWALFTAEKYDEVVAALDTLPQGNDTLLGEAAYLAGRSHFQLKQYDKAGPLLQKAADTRAPFAEEAALLRGQSLAEAGKPGDAMRVYAAAIDTFAQGKLVDRFHFRRGEAAAAAGDTATATAEFAAVMTDHPDSPLAAYARLRAARLAMQGDEPTKTIELLANFRSNHAGHPLVGDAIMLQVSALQKLGQHDQALSLLGETPAAAIDNNRLAFAQAVSTAAIGQHAEAASKLATIRKQAPEFLPDRVLYELAFAQKNSDQADEALATFGELAALAPQSSLGREALFRQGEMLYDRGDFAAAATKFNDSTGTGTDEELMIQAYHLAGWSHLKAQKYAQAVEAWQAQLKKSSDDELARDARWLVGEALFQSGDYGAAVAQFVVAGDALPSAPGVAPLVLLHAGQAAGQTAQWQQSIDWLERLRSEFPQAAQHNEGLYELAVALQRTDKLDEARQLFASVATGSSPLAYRARFMEGEMQFAAKQYEQAVRTFFRVFAGSANAELGEDYRPWQAEAMFEAARCLEQLDRTEASKKLYAELVTRFPEHPKAELARKQLGQ